MKRINDLHAANEMKLEAGRDNERNHHNWWLSCKLWSRCNMCQWSPASWIQLLYLIPSDTNVISHHHCNAEHLSCLHTERRCRTFLAIAVKDAQMCARHTQIVQTNKRGRQFLGMMWSLPQTQNYFPLPLYSKHTHGEETTPPKLYWTQTAWVQQWRKSHSWAHTTSQCNHHQAPPSWIP